MWCRMSLHEESIRQRRPTALKEHPSRLWMGVLLAPAAWIAQGGLGWWIGYLPCTTMNTSTARVLLAVMSAVALAIGMTGLVIAWTSWGRVSPHRDVMRI